MSVEVAMERYNACPQCLAVFRKQYPRCPLDGAAVEMVRELPLIGKEIAGRYLIEACIGEGGMGQVYRAKHTRISRKFAIKVLHGDLIADRTMRERFSREAEAASRLSHPNLVGVVDFGETDVGLLYLVMDYVKGVSLADMLEEEDALDQDRAMDLVRQMAAGLEHAHSLHLIHRDFKPDNVIVTSNADGEVAKILDFGIARLGDMTGTLTTEGVVMGTPAFMAPEQATSAEVDARTDLFSLGLVTYQMLSGRLPFDGSPMEMLRQYLVLDPPRMSERAPDRPQSEALEQMVRRLLARNPEERFQSATELIEAIDSLFAPARTRRASASLELSSDAGCDVAEADTAALNADRLASAPHGSVGDDRAFADTVHFNSEETPAQSRPDDEASPGPRVPETEVVEAFSEKRRGLIAVLAVAGVLGVAALVLALGPSRSGDGSADAEISAPTALDESQPVTPGVAAAHTAPGSEIAPVAPAVAPPDTTPGQESGAASDDDADGATSDPPDEKDEATRARDDGKETRRKRRRDRKKADKERGKDEDGADQLVGAEKFSARYTAVHQELQKLRSEDPIAEDVKKLERIFGDIDYFSYQDPVTGPVDYATLGRIQSKLRRLRKRVADSP